MIQFPSNPELKFVKKWWYDFQTIGNREKKRLRKRKHLFDSIDSPPSLPSRPRFLIFTLSPHPSITRSIYQNANGRKKWNGKRKREISVSRYLVSLELDFSVREAATFAKAAEPRQRTILAAELRRKQPTPATLNPSVWFSSLSSSFYLSLFLLVPIVY